MFYKYFRSALCVCALLQICAPLSAQNVETGSALGSQAESNQKEEPLKLAVVVGIDKYSPFSGVSPLNYAVADAKLLKDTLEGQGYSVLGLYDGEATVKFIKKAIQEIARLADGHDSHEPASIIFSFSGHGFAVEDENYLVAYDTDRDDVLETGFPLAEVVDQIKSTNISQKVLLIDACRNNPEQRSSSASFVDQQAEGVGILFSTRSGDVSYESSVLGNGVFTHFVAKGLSGEALNDSGNVSLYSLKRYVEKKVPEWTIRNLQFVQTPYQAGEYTGEFTLAHNPESADAQTNAKFVPVERVDPEPTPIQQPAPIQESTTLREENTSQNHVLVYLDPVDRLSGDFASTFSDYLVNKYEIQIAQSRDEAELTIEISAADVELSRSGQQFTIEGDLLIEGYSRNSDISKEFVSVKGVSNKNDREAVSAAMDSWESSIEYGSTSTAIDEYIRKRNF